MVPNGQQEDHSTVGVGYFCGKIVGVCDYSDIDGGWEGGERQCVFNGGYNTQLKVED